MLNALAVHPILNQMLAFIFDGMDYQGIQSCLLPMLSFLNVDISQLTAFAPDIPSRLTIRPDIIRKILLTPDISFSKHNINCTPKETILVFHKKSLNTVYEPFTPNNDE